MVVVVVEVVVGSSNVEPSSAIKGACLDEGRELPREELREAGLDTLAGGVGGVGGVDSKVGVMGASLDLISAFCCRRCFLLILREALLLEDVVVVVVVVEVEEVEEEVEEEEELVSLTM